MEEEDKLRRPEPRSEAEIFSDLRILAQSDGAIHEISALVYRDWVINYDIRDGRITDNIEHRWSTSKLNKNELMLLLGLLVQAEHDRTYSSINLETNFIERADTLLREFHDRVLVEAVPTFDPQTQCRSKIMLSVGNRL